MDVEKKKSETRKNEKTCVYIYIHIYIEKRKIKGRCIYIILTSDVHELQLLVKKRRSLRNYEYPAYTLAAALAIVPRGTISSGKRVKR